MMTDVKKDAKSVTPCPATPNWVSSIDRGRKQFIEPLRFTGSVKDARVRLLEVFFSLKRARVFPFSASAFCDVLFSVWSLKPIQVIAVGGGLI